MMGHGATGTPGPSEGVIGSCSQDSSCSVELDEESQIEETVLGDSEQYGAQDQGEAVTPTTTSSPTQAAATTSALH